MLDPMRTFHAFPADLLAPYVDRLWGSESSGGKHVDLPVLLPGTGAELYLHYRKPFRRAGGAGEPVACGGTHLFCIRGRPVKLMPTNDIGFVAVRFRAGMIHRFIDVPGGELMDRAPSAQDLWGTAGSALASRVTGAETLVERLRLVQSFLAERLTRQRTDAVFEHAVRLLYERCADLTIEHLASRVGLGRRQLERRFNAVSGQSPIELRHLARFQKTVRALMLDGGARTADTALANGYYDQAHFIRHFRELVAESPERHLRIARARTHFYNPSRQAGAMIAAPPYP